MSKLATFRLEEDIWDAFLAATKEEGVSASSALLEFVKWYVAGNRLAKGEALYTGIAPDSKVINNLKDKLREDIYEKLEVLLRIQQGPLCRRIKEELEENLYKSIEEKLDERLDVLESTLYKRIEKLEERLGELAA
ncbi:hypothetical protein F7734_52055 [Scytonema sp. UIC 10036]|uniref:hypothetical protein n=1 Tax=Scytonema sp. UIC 10036 TaxID=2304196 RepID=UPI0012DAA59C|nr:hypothetical protein [Scytonema sp. UIC 10036]MUH00358.1 hypothetical protein [Scytonema sp. UIC 10036]